MSKVITTTEVRLSYENLLVPRAQNEGDDPTFSTMVLVPKSDTATVDAIKAAIKDAMEQGVTSKWNGKRPSNLKYPLRDGDVDRADDPNSAGMWFFNAKGPRAGAEAPFLYGKGGRLVKAGDPDAEQVIYSGVHGRISLNFYPYDRQGNKGVAAGIVAFLSNEHGERLDNRPTESTALAAFGIDPLAVQAEEDTHDAGDSAASAPANAAPKASAAPAISAEDDPWG